MAKKPKLNFGEGDGHNFFAKHVEKLILAAVAALVAFFVYSGFSIEGIDPSKNPVQLKDQANSASTKLDSTRWEDVMDQDERKTDDIARRLGIRKDTGVLPATPDALYQGFAIWNPQPFQIKAKRADPPLFAPEDVELEPGFAAIAMNGNTTDDELRKLGLEGMKKAQEEAKKKAEAQRKKEEKKMGYGGGGYIGSAGETSASSMEEASSPYAGSMAYSMGGSATASGPTLTPEQRTYHSSRGFRPAGGASMDMMMPGGDSGYSPYSSSAESSASANEGGYNPYGGGGAGMSTIPVGKYWITVKALVPFKKQWTEWEHALQDSHDYNPARDTPSYFYYSVERVEVDDAGNTVDGSQRFWKPEHAAWYAQNWYAGVADPILDMANFDPLLTNPCPPILMRDLDPHQLHSSGKTPKRKIIRAEPVMIKRSTDAPPPSGETGPDVAPGPSARGPMAGAVGGYNPYGAMGGAAGYNPYGAAGDASGYNPYGAAGSSGGYNPYGAAGSSGGYNPYGSSGSYNPYGAGGASATASESYNPYGSTGESYNPYGQDGSSGYGGMYPGMGGMGTGYGMSGQRMAGPAADYKLFRFYDFDVVPEKSYKYRVKLYLRDPNHPQAPMPAPPVAYLEDEVVDRIKKIDAEDAKKTQETGQLQQTFWVETEWSEWSAASEIPPQYQIAAGPVTPARTTPVQNVEVQDPAAKEAEASVLALVFDKAKGADVPGLLPAARGAVLNFKGPANVLHPVNLQVLPLTDYDFKSDVLVLDVRGGQQLPTTNKADIDHKAPGEVLLMDSEGALIVHNELDDVLEYTNNIFKEPEKPKVIATEDEGYPGYPGSGYGYPGAGKPKRGRGPGSGS